MYFLGGFKLFKKNSPSPAANLFVAGEKNSSQKKKGRKRNRNDNQLKLNAMWGKFEMPNIKYISLQDPHTIQIDFIKSFIFCKIIL